MPSVSAIILTKDSQRTIEACIQALKPAVDRIIVVDTGSTDETVQIAKDNGAHVYHFEWRDDFSVARNFGDSLATTDWVIHIDSDEILRAEDTDKIRKACVQFRKTSDPVLLVLQIINSMEEATTVASAGRMYRRRVFVWRGIIHEQLFTKRGEKSYAMPVDINLLHDGYDARVVNHHEKKMRNIRLLKKGLEQEPDNPTYHFFLGRDYKTIDEYQAAIPHLRHCIDLFEQQDMTNQLENAYKLLGQCLESVGDYAGAEEVAASMVGKFAGYKEGWYTAPTS